MSINFPYYTTSTSNQGDLYYNDDTLLLHADGVTGSNNTGTFVDASTNTFVISRTGTPAQGSVNPFGTNWSAYFNGATTGTVYASTVTTSSFAFGTNNFTIEAWVNAASTVSNYPLIIGNYVTTFTTNAWGLYYNRIDTGNFYFSASNGGMTLASGSTYIVPGWNHVAVSRNGATASYNYAATSLDGGVAARLFIGDAGGNDTTTRFNGYISNLRVVNGSAVYTSAFTPSTVPLTTVTNTALLTLASNYVKDLSTNTFATTASSGVSIQRFNPFGNTQTYSISSATIQGSTYFDGSTGYLSFTGMAFSTNAYTVEFWFNANSFSTYWGLLGTGNANALSVRIINTTTIAIDQFGVSASNFTVPTMNTGTWYHVAAVRNAANTATVFLNGIRSSSGIVNMNNNYSGLTNNLGLISPNYYPGYISNMRVINGTSIYDPTQTTITIPTQPLSTVSNTVLLTCQTSQSIVDVSTVSNTVTVVGTAVPSLQTPFARVDTSTAATLYGGSIYFNGSTDYLTATSANFSSTGDLTLEAWAYITSGSTYQGIASLRDSSGTIGGGITISNTGNLEFVIAAVSYTSTSCPLNQWFHVALVRQGSSTNNCSCYLNGIRVGQFTSNSQINGASNVLIIGRYYANGTNQYLTSGYISNVRYIIGTALYTANFTPSTTPLTTSSQGSTNTTLLIPGINAGIYDSNMQNNLVTVGSAQISSTSTSTVKFGAGSVYLNGSGYISSPYSPAWILSGNFTIECWLYWSAHGSYGGIVGSANNNTGAAITAGWFLDFNSTNNTLQFEGQGSVSIITTNVIPQNQWVHIAVVRSGSTITHYLNGTANGSGTSSQVFNSTSYPLYVGVSRDATSYLTGYIDDFRITNGVARYTANFTPPTASFADIQLVVTTSTNATFTTSTNIGSVTWGYNTATTRWGGIQEPTASVNLTPMSIEDQLNTSTGYFSLPTGTTQQRPVNPQGGYMRYNTTLDSVEYYNFITGWTTIP